ncbi:uncharacterized protein LOC129909684 [Episyrphus balteatus]|uniref:uncharacterized protein LOC129909684 n=1 Tax=Episyrphus balteatus TaxID=286459 RepID=UPI002485335D|nr:uncharacterized protein LOC129909684 [Episyrphus balteatus]
MASSKVLLLCCFLVIFTQISQVSTNIILECISILYCNGNAPVCGTNGTHCWHSKSDCERAKFNCLHLNKKDFDKVDLGNCNELTIGGIKECCVKKTCSNKKEQICAQSKLGSEKKCRWFKNRCELKNHNCGNETNSFIETDKSSCDFGFGQSEQYCTKPNVLKTDELQ